MPKSQYEKLQQAVMKRETELVKTHSLHTTVRWWPQNAPGVGPSYYWHSLKSPWNWRGMFRATPSTIATTTRKDLSEIHNELEQRLWVKYIRWHKISPVSVAQCFFGKVRSKVSKITVSESVLKNIPLHLLCCKPLGEVTVPAVSQDETRRMDQLWN